MPSTQTVTGPACRFSALWIATASKTEPPGLLSRRSTGVPSGSAPSSARETPSPRRRRRRSRHRSPLPHRSPGRGSHTSLPCRHSCSVDRIGRRGAVVRIVAGAIAGLGPRCRRRAGALRLAGARAVAQAEACRARGVGGVLAVHFLDVVAGRLDHLAPRGDAGLHCQHLRLDVLQRIDPVPARRDPLHRPHLYRRIGVERARQHRGLEPAQPDHAAELVHDHAMLQLADAAAELDEFGAQGRVVRLPDVAGDEMIGQPQRGRDRQQRAVLERLVAAADIGRGRELHVLARQQHLHRAGLEARNGGAVEIRLGLSHHGLFGRGLGDEAREHRRGLLPVELGVVVLVEQEQPHHGRRDMRQSPDLARIDRPVDVQHVGRRHAHRLRDHRSLVGAVTRMPAAEVVGHPPPDPVELDPAADAVAVGRRLGLLEGQHRKRPV
jgi:hypothetical protein